MKLVFGYNKPSKLIIFNGMSIKKLYRLFLASDKPHYGYNNVNPLSDEFRID